MMIATLLMGAAAGRWSASPAHSPLPPASARPGPGPAGLTEEALRFYAAGQFASACARFAEAVEEAPANAATRTDAGRCFETWGWRTLSGGRPEEAALLFRQGLAVMPDDPSLLRAAGLASIHAGRLGEAVGSLEAAVRVAPDTQARLLLARLYDSRDDAERAVTQLRAIVATEPLHEEAQRLLDKVEREHGVEAGFQREAGRHFVLKFAAGTDASARRAILSALEAARERLVWQLGTTTDPVIVILYERPQFDRVAPSHAWVMGLFDGKIRLPVDQRLPGRAELERLLVHEYAHAVIHQSSRGRAPRWLQEGLAQTLEGRAAPPRLAASDGMTLEALERLVSDADPVHAHAGYGIALAVVTDLLQRGGMSSMRALLGRLAAGESLDAAVPMVYGWPVSDLESQWRQHGT
jgi:tetratricopeptide (TPR) repeat protein